MTWHIPFHTFAAQQSKNHHERWENLYTYMYKQRSSMTQTMTYLANTSLMQGSFAVLTLHSCNACGAKCYHSTERELLILKGRFLSVLTLCPKCMTTLSNKQNLGYAELDIEAWFCVEPSVGLGVGCRTYFNTPTGILKNYQLLNPDTTAKPGSNSLHKSWSHRG